MADADLQDLAMRLAYQGGHPDPCAMVVRGQTAVGFSPGGVFSHVPVESLVPLWTLFLGVALEIRREVAALAEAAAQAKVE